MSKEIAATEEKALTLGMDRHIVVSPEQMVVIKNTIFKGASDDELKLFIYHCQRKGTHPMDKLIHPIVRQDRNGNRTIAFQASIDFLRSESESAGDYRGMKGPFFEFDEHGKLDSATVVVLREINGHVIEFTGTAYWSEFYPGEKMGFMYDKMPRHMLAKCAEALARRQAWPKKLGDLYTPEEMAAADNPAPAAQNNRQQRSSTVKPPQQNQKQQGNVVDAEYSEGPTVDDKIEMALAQLSGGDYPEMQRLLKEASEFDGKQGGKVHLTLDRLPTANITWKQKTLDKLEAMIQSGGGERNPGEEG